MCNSCASLAGLVLCFIACYILLVIAPLLICCSVRHRDMHVGNSSKRHKSAQFTLAERCIFHSKCLFRAPVPFNFDTKEIPALPRDDGHVPCWRHFINNRSSAPVVSPRCVSNIARCVQILHGPWSNIARCVSNSVRHRCVGGRCPYGTFWCRH